MVAAHAETVGKVGESTSATRVIRECSIPTSRGTDSDQESNLFGFLSGQSVRTESRLGCRGSMLPWKVGKQEIPALTYDQYEVLIHRELLIKMTE